jgi:inner membrane protein
MIGLYAYLYAALRAEDYALVVGALGLFALLAGFMYVTRHIDWYAVELGSFSAGAPAGKNPAVPR